MVTLIAKSSCLALILIACAVTATEDPVLGLKTGEAGKLALTLDQQVLDLETLGLPGQTKALVAPLKITASEGDSVMVEFGVGTADGDVKFIAVWLGRSAGNWSKRKEWQVEKYNHKEMGERNEAQVFAFDADGTLHHYVKRNNIVGVETTCPQGCCKVWQTKTVVTEEHDVIGWNNATQQCSRKEFKKWYIAGVNEGLFNIALKVHGNHTHLAQLCQFNPGLEKQAQINEGQKILVEWVK